MTPSVRATPAAFGTSNDPRSLPLDGTGRIQLVPIQDRRQIDDRRALCRGGRRGTDDIDGPERRLAI